MHSLYVTAYAIINIVAFFLYCYDKLCAKRKLWRISEALLLGMAFCFGAVGAFLAMQLFRHKTRHMKFRYGVPLLLIIQLVLIIGMH